MNTKVKGDAIKEGSIPLSALSDSLQAEINAKYGLSGVVCILNSNNTTSDIFTISDYFVYVSSKNTIIKLNLGGQTDLSQLSGPSTIINSEVINGYQVKFSVSGSISYYGDLIIGRNYNKPPQETPDWNAQPGDAGYIENKPFYVVNGEIKTLDEKYIPDTIARKSDIPVPIIINYNTIKDAANSEVNTISEQTWLKYIANDTYKNYDWIIQRDGIKYNCTVIPDYDNDHIQILYFTRNEIEGTSGPLDNAIMKYSGLRIQLLPYTENTYLIYKISNGGSLETREFVFGENYNNNAYLIAAAQMSGIDTIDCKWVYTTKDDKTITVNGQYFHIENSITNVDAIFSVKDKSLTYVDGNGLINKVTFADNGSYDISKNNLDIPDTVVNINYLDLKSLRDNSQLIPGQQYRITDYVTTTTHSDTQSAGHQFDIIVIADDVNVLNEKARAIQHEGDTYFANSDLSAWEIWYCLDYDSSRFAWADNSESGRGVIYRMIDDKNNDCPYDFKNIMFKCPITDTNTSTYTGYYYTFTNINSAGEITDKSLSEANNNIIGVYTDNKSRLYYLPHNIFINVPTNEDDTAMCHSNILGKNCHNNFFKKGCICNILETNCHDNFFDYNCRFNKFGINCTWNVIGGGSYYNTFGINCSNNKFGKDCDSNFMMNYCRYNELGKECSYNLFNSNCCYNSFRTSKSSAGELRPYCKYNVFGPGCQYNVIWNSSTASSNYSIQGITITPNVMGTESAYNFINASTNKTSLYVAKATDGTIKIKNIGDLF